MNVPSPLLRYRHHAAETGDEQVGPAVVVVVAHHGSLGPAGIAHARLVGDVGKRAVVIVVVERAARLLAGLRHLHALRIGEVDVGPAVAVVVDEGHAAAHRLDDVFLFRAGEMFEGDAGGSGDVDQLRIGLVIPWPGLAG